MKSLIVIIVTLTLSHQCFANFLSYKTTTNIKQVYKDKKMAAMMKKYQPKDSSTASTSMTYVHNGKMMVYEDSQPQTLIDLGNNKMITFMPKKKQYTVMTVDKLVKAIEKMNKKADMKISSNYKKVKGRKKIGGITCQMYQSVSQTQFSTGVGNSKTSSKDCLWMNPPAAWKEYQMKSLKAFYPHIHKIAIKGNGSVADLGLPLYTEMKIDVMGAAQQNPQVAAMIPETYNISRVSNISTKPFNKSKIQIPKGYTPLKRRKAKKTK